jgi:hypothetical protein
MPEDYFVHKVQAATTSISRSRTVFLISNFATLIIIAANFNLYFSWLRYMVNREVADPYKAVLTAIAEARVEETMLSAPLIGVKFFAADIGILSGLAMLVLSVWLYYALRREQHAVGRIAVEVLDGDSSDGLDNCTVSDAMIERAQYVLYSLSSAFGFTTSSRGRLAIGDGRRRTANAPEPLFTTVMTSILVWAPCWTALLSLALDALSLYFPSALLPGKTIGDIVAQQAQQQVEVYVRFAATSAMILIIMRMLTYASYYWKWTGLVYDSLARAVELAELRRRFPLEADKGIVPRESRSA